MLFNRLSIVYCRNESRNLSNIAPRLTNSALGDQSGHVVRGSQTVPAFAQESVTFTFRTGATVSETLPAVTGGEGGLTYALGSVALPTGLTYTAPGNTDTHGGTITGTTPATAQASTAYTVSVTDGDGDSDTLTVNIALTNATPDVNGDGTLDTEDVLVMYYTYTALNLLEDASIGERLRRLVFRPLHGSQDDDDTGYMAMLNAAKDWKLVSAGDVNDDGNVDTLDVLVMYYTYTALNLLEDPGVGERLRRLVFRPLRGGSSTLTDDDTGYMAMLNAAKALTFAGNSP